VTGCPSGAHVHAEDCVDVGTFTREDHSGGIDSSGNGRDSTSTTTVTLYRDRFYTFDFSTFKTTCYAYNCQDLASSSQTIVGDWSESGGAPPYTISTLHSWTFKKSTSSCP